MTEARWRGVWGTVRALKMNKFGTMHRFGTSAVISKCEHTEPSDEES